MGMGFPLGMTKVLELGKSKSGWLQNTVNVLSDTELDTNNGYNSEFYVVRLLPQLKNGGFNPLEKKFLLEGG